MGKHTEAIQSYRKALEIETDPYSVAEVWNNIGICFLNMNNFQEASESYDKAIEIERSAASLRTNASEDDIRFIKSHTWFLKGNLMLKLQKYDEAKDCYDEALKINRADPDTWLNKGLSHYHLGEHKKAIQSYRTALELATDPYTVSDIWNNIGVSYYDLGDFEEARMAYDNAIEAYANNAKVWYNRSKTLKPLKAKELGFQI